MLEHLVSGDIVGIIVVRESILIVTREWGGGGADAIAGERVGLSREEVRLRIQGLDYLGLIRGDIEWVVVIIVHGEGAGGGD